jgi:hypothetical protein
MASGEGRHKETGWERLSLCFAAGTHRPGPRLEGQGPNNRSRCEMVNMHDPS